MDESVIPLEAGLEATHLSYTKGCYIGQEIIARIHARGHTNRALTGFTSQSGLSVAGDRIHPATGETAKEVGWITSVAESPALGCGIALGYLRHEHRTPGTLLVTKAGLELIVADLPFVSSQP